MNACLSDFVVVVSDSGQGDSQPFCDANRNELTATWGCETDAGAKAYCNVNRIRTAYYFN